MAYLPTPMSSEGLTGEALMVFEAITTNRKGQRVLRASKPTKASGEIQYAWRIAAFTLSRNPVHHCMPVCADFSIQGVSYDERRRITKHLDAVVDEIIKAQPATNQFGTMRWAKAFGMI